MSRWVACSIRVSNLRLAEKLGARSPRDVPIGHPVIPTIANGTILYWPLVAEMERMS
jgi:hypothetical protein